MKRLSILSICIVVSILVAATFSVARGPIDYNPYNGRPDYNPNNPGGGAISVGEANHYYQEAIRECQSFCARNARNEVQYRWCISGCR